MNRSRWTFETFDQNGKLKSVTVEGCSYTVALKEARDKLGCASVSQVDDIRTEVLMGDTWVTTFDAWAGVV